MATLFETVYDRFYKRLQGDKKFFNYNNLTEAEIQELVKDHSRDLLQQSIDLIYEMGAPDINLYDVDETIGQFNEDLVQQEIGLFSKVMYYNYYNESRNRINTLGLTFSSNELNVFSPANERNSLLAMISQLQDDIEKSIESYLSRDRLSWEFKSIYEGE